MASSFALVTFQRKIWIFLLESQYSAALSPEQQVGTCCRHAYLSLSLPITRKHRKCTLARCSAQSKVHNNSAEVTAEAKVPPVRYDTVMEVQLT